VRDLEDLTDQQTAEITEFFESYKNLEEGKETTVEGWEDKAAAHDAIEHSQELYDEHFG
jgi:inorganic pyrophosphatase